jgi:flagellar biogenesis protein FliO
MELAKAEVAGSRGHRTTMLTLALLIEAKPGGIAGADMAQYFGVCVVLIALIVLGGVGFKRLFAKSLSARAAKRSLQVLDVLPLGGKQRLAVVRCYERTYIVGLGDKELCLVGELDTQATPELAAKHATPLPFDADQSAFQRLLQLARPRPPAKPAASATLESGGILG